jgi:hypothetical protein
VRRSSEMVGYERARISEKDLSDSLSRSLSELRAGLEKQHEGDLDALSEEAVKVTNRLKAKLTSLELKNEQTEEYNAQLIALRAKDEMDHIHTRQRLLQLETSHRGREEAARGMQALSSSEAARDVAQIASRMEILKERLMAECDALRLSEREHKKAFEAAVAERDDAMNERQRRHKAEIDGYETRAREAALSILRLTNELKDAKDGADKEASSLINDLTKSLEKNILEKNQVVKDLAIAREANVRGGNFTATVYCHFHALLHTIFFLFLIALTITVTVTAFYSFSPHTHTPLFLKMTYNPDNPSDFTLPPVTPHHRVGLSKCTRCRAREAD